MLRVSKKQPEGNIKHLVSKKVIQTKRKCNEKNAALHRRLNQYGPQLDESGSFCFFKSNVKVMGGRAIIPSVFSAIKQKPLPAEKYPPS